MNMIKFLSQCEVFRISKISTDNRSFQKFLLHEKKKNILKKLMTNMQTGCPSESSPDAYCMAYKIFSVFL